MDQSINISSSSSSQAEPNSRQQQQPDSSETNNRYNRFGSNNGNNNQYQRHRQQRNQRPNSHQINNDHPVNSQNSNYNRNPNNNRNNNTGGSNSSHFHQRPGRSKYNNNYYNNHHYHNNNKNNDELPPRLQRNRSNNKSNISNNNHAEQENNHHTNNVNHHQQPHSESNQSDLIQMTNSINLIPSQQTIENNDPNKNEINPFQRNDVVPGPSYSQSNNFNNRPYFRNRMPQKFTSGGNKHKKSELESQREIMDELLRKAQYDCIVCCDHIRIHDRTWNCSICCNVFHLKCIQQWARKSSVNPSETSSSSSSGPTDLNSNLNFPSNEVNNSRNNNNNRTTSVDNKKNNSEWRCPTCQSVQRTFPHAYYCFCGKVKEPETSNYRVPHSCGETCSRDLNLFNIKLENEDYFDCKHRCTLMCHPGKCPPCTLKMQRICSCKKTKVYLNCSSKLSDIKCPETCNKLLDCKKHRCQRKCHFGSCDPCDKIFDMKCFCGKNSKQSIQCKDLESGYCCGQKCSKPFSCGNHSCEKNCHPGSCGSCPYDPQTVTHCPCGETSLKTIGNYKPRTSCLDPIPHCFRICGKQLPCGNDKPHLCQSFCHSGPCPPCDSTTIIRCYCGANSQKMDCKDMVDKNFQCKRKCNKRLSCGRHKCLKECCIDKEHICRQICGRKLGCGQHNCAEQCHPVCGSCPNIIWTEVYCNCRSEFLEPPLPCGTPKPQCSKPCSRDHGCDHPPNHTCHDDPECPPCTEFVSRRCYGGHEVRNNIHCYEKSVSCGRFCQKPLQCGLHKCPKVCHDGECPSCSQKCAQIRTDCLHPCGLPCHQNLSPICPESPCRSKIKIYCECEFKTKEVECNDVMEPRKFQQHLDNLIKRYSFNGLISLDEMKDMVRQNILHSLPCDAECAKEKRNKNLAEALGIDPNLPATSGINPINKYSDQLKNEARSNPHFIMTIHDKFVQLIDAFKQSNQKIMCYNFTPMNRNCREIIHTYASHYNLKTESVDKEPNRSVMITANKTSMIPKPSLLESVGIDVKELRPKQSVVKYKKASEESKNKQTVNHFDD